MGETLVQWKHEPKHYKWIPDGRRRASEVSELVMGEAESGFYDLFSLLLGRSWAKYVELIIKINYWDSSLIFAQFVNEAVKDIRQTKCCVLRDVTRYRRQPGNYDEHNDKSPIYDQFVSCTTGALLFLINLRYFDGHSSRLLELSFTPVFESPMNEPKWLIFFRAMIFLS